MAKELEINVRPIFSTPLLVFTIPDYERINQALRRAILEREASTPAYADYEVVGWSSPHDLSILEWAGPALKGYQLWAATVDKHGGLLGHKIVLKIVDDAIGAFFAELLVEVVASRRVGVTDNQYQGVLRRLG